MQKNTYGTVSGKYGRVNCDYCDGKAIKREHMGNHLYKFHKDKLKENFDAYLNMPNWNQPFVNTKTKLYTFCFVCHQCHSTTGNLPSKPAIKHMTGKCCYENQYNRLKALFEDDKSPADVITIPVVVTPTYKTHISNHDECPIHAEEISNLKKEIAKIKNEMIEFIKNYSPKLTIKEIPEACGDCKEWGDAFSDKVNEVNELKEKLGI